MSKSHDFSLLLVWSGVCMAASSWIGFTKVPQARFWAVLQVYWSLHRPQHSALLRRGIPAPDEQCHQPPLFRAGESWPAIAWSGFQFGEWQPWAVVRNGSGSGGNFSPKPEILAPIFGTHTQPFILRTATIIKTKFSFSDVLNILHWPLLVICWERFFRTRCRGWACPKERQGRSGHDVARWSDFLKQKTSADKMIPGWCCGEVKVRLVCNSAVSAIWYLWFHHHKNPLNWRLTRVRLYRGEYF